MIITRPFGLEHRKNTIPGNRTIQQLIPQKEPETNITFPETSSKFTPENLTGPKRKFHLNQPSIFRGFTRWLRFREANMANSSKNHEHVVFVRHHLVGGLNPLQKYQTNWIISLSRGENQKYFKPPTTNTFRGVSIFNPKGW